MKKFEKKSYLNCLIATMLVAALAACVGSGPGPDPTTARQYKGTIQYSYTGTDQSFTVGGTVIWTEEEAGDDLFLPSGTLRTDISLEGCDPFSGSVAISGGEMYFDVPADGRYMFNLGTETATLSCNGLDLPYVLSSLMLSGSCDGGASELGDQQTLEGSYDCGDGFQLDWSFTLWVN